MAGLDHITIAQQLHAFLEGITGGSILEGTEELPVRVRISGDQRQDMNSVASLDLLPMHQERRLNASNPSYPGIPFASIATPRLQPETVSVFRLNGDRMNEIQAYLQAGVLPASVLKEFKGRLAEADFHLPPEYSISYGGAEEQRNDAVGELIANMFVVVTLMVSALVLSLGSFRLALLLFGVAGLSVGLGILTLWLFDYPWGFMSMVGMMGMIGVAVNDSIVVLAAIRSLPAEQSRDKNAILEKVMGSTRHILSTTLTTIVGFTPLYLYGGDFWSPVALAISGGVGGATLIALLMIPCAYLLLFGQTSTR